jgi:hypothetical protein
MQFTLTPSSGSPTTVQPPGASPSPAFFNLDRAWIPLLILRAFAAALGSQMTVTVGQDSNGHEQITVTAGAGSCVVSADDAKLMAAAAEELRLRF